MSKNNGSTMAGPTNIPELLRGLDRWVGWVLKEKKGKLRKVPVHPDGSNFSTSRDTPYSYKEIVDAGLDPGFVLTDGVKVDGWWLIAFDLDACRDTDTGEIMEWAGELINRFLNSYTEITPSGGGLRLWTLTKNKPDGELRKIKNVIAAPNTNGKKAEIETFGLGRACYVTVSGNVLPNTSSRIHGVRSLDWLCKRYPHLETAADVELPVGQGKAPSWLEIDRLVTAHPEGDKLIEGLWEEVVPEESASEGYYRLVQRVIGAARGHGQAAIDFLLEHTAYGAGLVDSAEPDRYRREGWVGAEVARIASKAPRTQPDAFSDEYVESSHMPAEGFTAPPEAEPVKRTLILQVGEFVKKVGTREWLVRDLFPSDGLAQVFGEPGAGKTPVTLHLAIATAAGLPTWFGREIDKPGPVVYIIGEDEAGIRDRVVGQMANMLDPLEDLDKLPLYFTMEPARITDEANVELWIKTILEATGGKMPRLIVVDTMSRNFGTGNENSTEDMQAYVDGCSRLSARLGILAKELAGDDGQPDKALVLGVHHTGLADKSRARGASVLNGALDTNILVTATGKRRITLEPKKVKGAAKGDPFDGTLTVARLGTDERGRKITAITLEDRAPVPGEAFPDLEPDTETTAFLQVIEDLNGEKISQTKLAERAGMNRDGVRAILGRVMSDLGLVVRSGATSAKSAGIYTITQDGAKYLAKLAVSINPKIDK